MYQYVIGFFQKIKNILINLNLFPSVPPSVDEHQLRNERISTRLFIIFLLLSLTILILYTSLINITQTINVQSPTITDYDHLYLTHSQTLTCPCKTVSINYDVFIQLNYTIHQICHSIFVTQNWIDYLAPYSGRLNVTPSDFRAIGTFVFQALRGFCNIANELISNRLIEFYSTQYVTASVVSRQVFESQTESFITQFISTMTNDFVLSLSTIRYTTQANALLSAEISNYLLSMAYLEGGTIPHGYGNGSCSSSGEWVDPFTFVDFPNNTILFTVPGFYIGCYLIDSLLQSDLRCFYDQMCINQLQSYLNLTSPMNLTALDKSLLIRFKDNSTINELLNDLMVEKWISPKMFEDYYNKCNPAECVYTIKTKNSIIYIITTIIGLIGGLTTALKLIVPRVVQLIAFCGQKWYERHTTVVPSIET
ncbi:hypothetical protein I4U23_027318 [Adineta vaga]|nr:hypothetical protein I4U23_027318 [Adineta vaga]